MTSLFCLYTSPKRPHLLQSFAYRHSENKHRHGNTNAEKDPLQIPEAFTGATTGFSNAGFTRASRTGFFVGSLMVDDLSLIKARKKENALRPLIELHRLTLCRIRGFAMPGEVCSWRK